MNEKIKKENQRIVDGFYLFSLIFPLTNKNDKFKEISKEVKVDLTQLAKNIINAIPQDGLKPENLTLFINYIKTIKHTCQYMLNEVDDLPSLKCGIDNYGNKYYTV